MLHVTTAGEMDLLGQARDVASVEVTPQHLTLAAPDCYDTLGTLAQMNPPIREAVHRDALWKAIADGVVDVVGVTSSEAYYQREWDDRISGCEQWTEGDGVPNPYGPWHLLRNRQIPLRRHVLHKWYRWYNGFQTPVRCGTVRDLDC